MKEKRKSNKIFLTLLVIGGILPTSLSVANQCPTPLSTSRTINLVDTPTTNYEQNGGVSLNKTLSLMNDIADIKGAAYDAKKGEVVFIGEGVVPIGERVDFDDLVVAVQSVYNVDQFGNETSPGISFEATASSILDGKMSVRFAGATPNTQFGKILYESDYILKKLGQGVDENGNLLRSNLAYSALGYISSAERLLARNLVLKDNNNREFGIKYVFVPDQIKLAACDPSVVGATCTEKSFVFTEMSMKVDVSYEYSDGVLVPTNLINAAIIEEAIAFKNNITQNYDRYLAIPGLQVLKKLKRLGKIVSVVRFIKENRIPIDLSFLQNYKPTNVTTPTHVNLLQLCKASNGVISGGTYVPGSSCSGARIIGGVKYDLPNTSTTTTATDGVIRDALQNSNRVLNPRTAGDMAWEFDSSLKHYRAISQTLAPSGKDGAAKFASVDIGLPGTAVGPLNFTRYYDSFSAVPSGFGPGWSEFPYSLKLAERIGVWCPNNKRPCVESDVDTTIIYSRLTIVDRLAGREIDFFASGETTTYTSGNVTVERPYYVSTEVNDVIFDQSNFRGNDGSLVSYFSYYKYNDVGQKLLQVMFDNNGNYPTVQRFVLSPSWDIIPIGDVNNDGNVDELYKTYNYDTQNRLTSIDYEDLAKSIKISYGSNGRIDRVYFISSNDGQREASYAYLNGRLDSVTKSGHVYKFSYADTTDFASGVVSSVTDQTRYGAQVAGFQTDLEGRANSTSSENIELYKSTFNRNLGETTYENRLGLKTTVKRDQKGRLTSTKSNAVVRGTAVAQETGYVYDASNPFNLPNILRNVSRNVSKQYSYDSNQNITSFIDEKNRRTTIERGFDTSDRMAVTIVTDAKTRSQAKKYDSQGRLIAFYRRVNIQNKTPILDAAGNSTGTYNFSFTVMPGYVIEYSYDPITGHLQSVSNDGKNLTDYPWINDKAIRVTKRNGFGQAEEITLASDHVNKYSYDSLSRVSSVKNPSDIVAASYKYYETGLAQDALASLSTPTGKNTYYYDIVNRVESSTDPRGVSVTRFRNAKSQIERVVEKSNDGKILLTTQYFYDDYGRMKYKIMPNGTRVDYVYDAFGRVQEITEKDSADATSTNNSPVIGTAPATTIKVVAGGSFSFDVNASDADGNSLKYSLVSAPTGMTIDPNTGVITWPTTIANSGNYNVTVQVTDGSGGATNSTFTVKVDDTVTDSSDNCVNVPNQDQRDTDSDGRGNACDADLNNDNIVNFADFAKFKSMYGKSDVGSRDADFNGDGVVDVIDLDMFRAMFGRAPG